MRKTLSTRLAVLIGAGGLLAGCGDNILPGGDDTPDIDANPDIPDGPPIDDGVGPTATIAGTVAVTDVTLTHPGAVAAPPSGAGGVRGGAISIVFSDLTENGGTTLFGTSPIGGCLITEFDATHTPHPPLDVGPITLTGDGLLKTVGPCTLQGSSYLCISDAGMDGTVAAQGQGASGAVTYTFTGETLDSESLISSYLNVNGFDTAGYNSGLLAFPVVGQGGPLPTNTLATFNPAGAGSALEASAADIDYTIINGLQPIPGAGDGRANFLGDETGEITITKAADADWPAIDFTTYTRGDGLDLDDESAVPHAFPFATPAALTFSCAGTNGDCGGEGTATLEAMIISGRATKKTPPATPFQMPTEVPGTDNWLEWQCAFLLSDTATMPVEAVQTIVDFDPTRVEMRVLRVAGTIINDGGLNETRILIGHGLVGHTDPP